MVDESNQPLDPLPRKLVHGSAIWHRLARVWIVRGSDSQILSQQRSLLKENNPGYWESFFCGHLHPGESYEIAAQRELREKLGVSLPNSELQLWKVHRFTDPAGKNNEFQAIFIVHWDGDIAKLRFEDGEVAQVAWKSIPEIRARLAGEGAPWTNLGYELALIEGH